MLFKLAPFTGVNKDLSVLDLPAGAVTDAKNVRFRDGMAELFMGQTAAYPPSPIAPISGFPVRIGTVRYWIVLSQTKAYCVTGTPAVWTNITRQTAGVDVNYAATLDTCWNGGVLNGVPILNNGVDVPQMWSPVATGTKLQALTAWPGTATCRVMRPFGAFMFAFDITKSGTRYPHRVKWSHPADPGTVPVSWDETDATKDAGEFDLMGAGQVIDAVPLRQSLIIYTENATHVCSLVGAPSIFSFQQVFSNSGILSADCAVEVEGTHVVLTSSDLIRHDGSTSRSLLDKQTRRWLFQNIDGDRYDRCFLARALFFNEVWVCFPQPGETVCTLALVYNYRDGAISIRELPGVTSASVGLVDEAAANTFDSKTLPFDSYLLGFDVNEFGAQLERTVLSSPGTSQLVLADSGSQINELPVQGYLERTGLDFGAPNQVKTLQRIRPRVQAAPGTVLIFRVAGQMRPYDPIVWSDPQTFTVGTDSSIDLMVSGRMLGYRIESATAYAWRLEGLDFEFQARGGW